SSFFASGFFCAAAAAGAGTGLAGMVAGARLFCWACGAGFAGAGFAGCGASNWNGLNWAMPGCAISSVAKGARAAILKKRARGMGHSPALSGHHGAPGRVRQGQGRTLAALVPALRAIE